MSATSQGFLPYGSNDSSVVLQHPLTSMPVTSAAFPYTNIVQNFAVPIFDPVKGMLCSDRATKNTFAGFVTADTPTFPAAILNSLGDHGQLTYEIETPAITKQNATFYCDGFVPNVTYSGGSMTHFLFTNQGGTEGVWLQTDTGGGVDISCNPGSVTASGQGFWLLGKRFLTTDTMNIGTDDFVGNGGSGYQTRRLVGSGGPLAAAHSYNKGSFCKIQVGWWGGPSGVVVLAVNGLKTLVVRRTANTFPISSFLFKIWLGGNIQGNASSFYIRNLQISTAMPTWVSKPGCSRIAIFGDSTTPINAGGWDIDFGNLGDLNTMRVIQSAFNNAGYDVDVFGSQNSGNSIDDDAQNLTLPGTASSAAGLMNVTAVTGTIGVGYIVTGAGVPVGTTVTGFAGGSGGTGNYNVSGGASWASTSVTFWNNTGLATWKDSILPSGPRATLLAGNYSPPSVGIPWPDVVVLVGGINDWGAFESAVNPSFITPYVVLNQARMGASMQRLINYWMWGTFQSGVVAGAQRTAVRRVIVMTPLSGRWHGTFGWGNNAPGPSAAAHAAMRSILASAVSWWNTSYPGQAGLVSMADYYQFVGGDQYIWPVGATPGNGSPQPPFLTVDGVHPTIIGQYMRGQCIAQALMPLLAT